MRFLSTLAVVTVALSLAACAPMLSATDSTTNTNTQANTDTASKQQAQLNFILAQQREDKGLGELRLPDGSLWYLPRPMFTQADLLRAESKKTAAGKHYISFNLNQAGTQRLTTISERFPGKFIVLTLDNSLQAIYRIENTISNGVLDIPMFSQQQADKIIDSLPR